MQLNLTLLEQPALILGLPTAVAASPLYVSHKWSQTSDSTPPPQLLGPAPSSRRQPVSLQCLLCPYGTW